MASFNENSDELILAIVADVALEDIVSLSKTCRHLREIALPAFFYTVALTWATTQSRDRILPYPEAGLILRTVVRDSSLAALAKVMVGIWEEIEENGDGLL
ncbi:hypothetical protein BU16DRAFT_564086 [Lophium mytilinum]|uniref:F-box domain-containing protein n=1 Tax=Lophium mytilinum TaxID=390894 RepID=A0A6A6QKG7_9PEZI|nr:hypothetical protein BU16DRAFT_564086 [Lophium mytilinum]